MSGEEPGIKPVVLYLNGEAVSTLNPLPAASLGSTTNLTVKGATSSGFVQGISRTLRDPYGLSQVFTGVTTAEYAYLLIRNRAEFQSLVNQRQLLPISFGVNVETANRIGRVRFVLNPTLSSTVDWQYFDQTSSSTEYAVPTSVTISGGRQIAAIDSVTQTVQDFSGLDLRMEAGDVLAIAIRSSTSTATISTSINWHEE